MTSRSRQSALKSSKRDLEREAKDGVDAIQRWYRAEVKYLTEEILDRLGEDKDADENEVVHEVIDSSQLVIYTHYNFWVLLSSNEHDAAIEEGFVDPSSWKDGVDWAALAFGALERDVYEEMAYLRRSPD